MIKRDLSKAQETIVMALVNARASADAEWSAAFKEQIELLRNSFGLPDGEYTISGAPGRMSIERVEQAIEAAPIADAPLDE